MPDLLPGIMEISRNAGNAILDVYAEDSFGIETKDDDSPLTRADLASHRIIVNSLAQMAPEIPVLSEESDPIDFSVRKHWRQYFLVDPLDGTKEFINRNDEFTVNIALIENGIPVMGVVFVPVQNVLYAGTQLGKRSAFIEKQGRRSPIRARQLAGNLKENRPVTVVASRRHGVTALSELMKRMEQHFPRIETINMGSSLKLCLIAEGKADFYPRLAPTSEWDTAAAQAIVEAAGGVVMDAGLHSLRYNSKEDILNPDFFVVGDPDYPWESILNTDSGT